ncbi:MAG: hypothetical protein Ct9H90mP24_6620 [Methanobacteriota archaeon]|nr:MAG: hypothetical protein Ct9H90mP24_6620 [Euryarchaeota archaeon]
MDSLFGPHDYIRLPLWDWILWKGNAVILNVMFGLPAVMTWAAFGTILRRAFTSPRSATFLNRGMGVSLFVVALWIVIPPDYYSTLLG